MENGFRHRPLRTGTDHRPGDGPTARARAGKMHSAMSGVRIPFAAVTS
ncbi:conserved protein of unknown function [Streptomyces murinus]